MATLRSNTPRRAFLLVPGIVLLITICMLVVMGPAAAQKSQKVQTGAASGAQRTLKDVLAQYQGQTTNLGVLKKISGDYFVVQEEGATAMYPFSAIQSFRILAPQEDVSVLLEIRLVAKD